MMEQFLADRAEQERGNGRKWVDGHIEIDEDSLTIVSSGYAPIGEDEAGKEQYASQCCHCGAGISAEGSWVCWECANKVKQCPLCGRREADK